MNANVVTNLIAGALVLAVMAYAGWLAYLGNPLSAGEIVTLIGGVLSAAALVLYRGKNGNGGSKIPKLVMLPLVLLVTACNTQNRITASQAGALAEDQPASVTEVSPDGTIRSAFNGLQPTAMMQDGDGTWITTPGAGGAVSFNPQTGMMYLWNPTDTEITGIEFTPGGIFKAESIRFTLSAVETARTDQVVAFAETVQGMTQAEAELHIRRNADLTDAAKEVLLRAVVPLLPIQ